MVLAQKAELRKVRGIEETDVALIKAFLQGAVYCWIKNRSGEPFRAQDLVGGENLIWEGTPLQKLYDKHIDNSESHEQAFESAAKDLGWLLKEVLHEDKRTFDIDGTGWVNSYRWIGDEP